MDTNQPTPEEKCGEEISQSTPDSKTTITQMLKHFDWCLFRWATLHSWYKRGPSLFTIKLVPVWGNAAEHYPYHPKYPQQNPPIPNLDGIFWHFEMLQRDVWHTDLSEAAQKIIDSHTVTTCGRELYLSGGIPRDFPKDGKYTDYKGAFPSDAWYLEELKKYTDPFMQEVYPTFKHQALEIAKAVLEKGVLLPSVCYPIRPDTSYMND
jgi:hypothetical protein